MVPAQRTGMDSSSPPVTDPSVRTHTAFEDAQALFTGVLFVSLAERARAPAAIWSARAAIIAFFGFQCVQAYRHAMDYRDDVAFWEATKNAVPNSAKAHLNYSVMLGARGKLEERREANEIALRLAPKWPMASVYLGDTLCRLHRPKEAMPHYLRGFDLAPNDMNLIALGVQCLWDEKMLQAENEDRAKLQGLAK